MSHKLCSPLSCAQPALPETFADEATLDEYQSRPSDGLIDDLARIEGDLIILGVAGKVGPSLARMVRRAMPGRRVVGVTCPPARLVLPVAGTLPTKATVVRTQYFADEVLQWIDQDKPWQTADEGEDPRRKPAGTQGLVALGGGIA